MSADIVSLDSARPSAPVIPITGAGIVTTGKRSINGRIDEIEALAKNPGPLTQFAVMTVLEAVCDESLRGDALWAAWVTAHAALEDYRDTDPDDWDYEVCKDKAERAVLALVHGNQYGGTAA
jgi:hypothetical protein